MHKLLAHRTNPEVLFQQNHCGVYRAKLTGKKWTDITKGLPSRFGFGFWRYRTLNRRRSSPMPLQGAEYRCNLNGALSVARSRDGGKTISNHLKRGLPQKNAHVAACFAKPTTADAHPSAGDITGTEGGTIFATRDAGDRWDVLAGERLPPVRIRFRPRRGTGESGDVKPLPVVAARVGAYCLKQRVEFRRDDSVPSFRSEPTRGSG